jgi:hypothetical protein
MAQAKSIEWEHLGHTGAGKDGNYDGTMINHWRDPATGAEYMVLDSGDGGSNASDGSPQWYRIDGTSFEKLPGPPAGFTPPPKKK